MSRPNHDGQQPLQRRENNYQFSSTEGRLTSLVNPFGRRLTSEAVDTMTWLHTPQS